MAAFYVVRLGQDSVPAIEQIDTPGVKTPFTIHVSCKQVPIILSVGDLAFIWLGTDNGKGGPTRWKQGIRALAEVTGIAGDGGYKTTKTVSLSIGLVLSASISKWDFVNSKTVPYKELYNLPVLGGNNYSSQVIQKVDPEKEAQNLGALISAIEEIQPGFKLSATQVYPSLAQLPIFSAQVDTPVTQETLNTGAKPSNQGDWNIPAESLADLDGLVGMEESAVRVLAALRSGMHVILTGPPGTGKTQLAEAICRKAGFPSWTVPATDQWTTFETIGGYFPTPVAEDSDSSANTSADRLDFLPGAVVDSISRGNCLIVDEINRADIDKAFGELFTLLAGNSVTLPYRRRGPNGFLRVRLQVENSPPETDIDALPLPPWWRMIGAMNDADKASLKRLSLAFVRRFAFVPIGIPSQHKYKNLLNTRLDSFDSSASTEPRLAKILAAAVDLFTDTSNGFGAIGMPFGPAIPLAILKQAIQEATLDSSRTSEQILASGLELYVAPQFQGRADKHEECTKLIRATIPEASISDAVVRSLAIWTGYDS